MLLRAEVVKLLESSARKSMPYELNLFSHPY